jgi:phosphinothricin acetyltransferase
MYLRIADVRDAADMVQIYAPFIRSSGITQEIEVPSTEAFAERVKTTLIERPWIVCDVDGMLAGYAYAGKHRERSGYQWCTEPSVYVDEKFHRSNIATALYTALFEILKKQHYVNAYAVITLPNPQSVAFHEKFGFTYLTTFKRIGFKLGKWHDVGWWEKQVNRHEYVMSDPIKFMSLDQPTIDMALAAGNNLLRRNI